MFCGTRSFSHVDDGGGGSPPSKTLKQSFSMSKKRIKKKHGSNQNPYSTAGLDKFEKTLKELDEKKEKILLRAKSHGDATVRFTYRTGSEDWIPIIIKKREAKEREVKMNIARTTKADAPVKRLSAPPSLKVERESKGVVNKTRVVNRELRRSCGWCRGWYWALVIVLILVLLMFGRSFAICLTAMLWYLVPMVMSGSKGLRWKELDRGVSDKSLGGGGGGGGVQELKSPRGILWE